MVVVVLDDGTLKTTLPDVTTAMVAAVRAPGMRLCMTRPISFPGVRSTGGHEAVTVELERSPLLQDTDGLEEPDVVSVIEEHAGAIDDVVDQTVVDRSQGSGHSYGGPHRSTEVCPF